MAQLHIRPSVKHGFHYIEFHVTLARSTALSEDILFSFSFKSVGSRVETYLSYQGSTNRHRTDFSLKPDDIMSQTQRRTDGWTWVPHKEFLSISKGRLKTSKVFFTPAMSETYYIPVQTVRGKKMCRSNK